MKGWGKFVLGFVGLLVGLPLYALPATLSLPKGIRAGLSPLTIDEAAGKLRAAGLQGVELVEAARTLVGERMVYSRRNSFDSPQKAFSRGYGYCTQMAQALTFLLQELGFEAKTVHAVDNVFADGSSGGHAWVQVKLDGIWKDIDSLLYDSENDVLGFTPGKVRAFNLFWRVLGGWGSTAVNAHRYYTTGVDRDF